ncbi:hypothetical protein ES332_A10G070800v1 [Gossypium tomentosum]|uniref:Uncharacterized protein n=1 Tax=Gossypium tomentosum TaxID=34277 RepID=A0A5D2NQ26_GOSTO|nr:hypothetical protein ES332_A10G070800v1 [Gossypium tomentosum]
MISTVDGGRGHVKSGVRRMEGRWLVPRAVLVERVMAKAEGEWRLKTLVARVCC